MFTSRLGRHRAAASLLLVGSLALIGAQQVLGTATEAEASVPQTVLNAHEVRGASAPSPMLVDAAVSTGQFEAAFQPTAVPTVAPTAAPTIAPTPAPAATLYESGIASTYGEGDGFEGNRTACGQIFHTNVIQIAHKSLPCGTHVRIEDTSTGNTVDAEVTDRGPYVAGRIVDLSWGAFRELEPDGPGLLHVNVYVLDQ